MKISEDSKRKLLKNLETRNIIADNFRKNTLFYQLNNNLTTSNQLSALPNLSRDSESIPLVNNRSNIEEEIESLFDLFYYFRYRDLLNSLRRILINQINSTNKEKILPLVKEKELTENVTALYIAGNCSYSIYSKTLRALDIFTKYSIFYDIKRSDERVFKKRYDLTREISKMDLSKNLKRNWRVQDIGHN